MSYSMDVKFNSYEYLMIRQFTSTCYGRNYCISDRIKIYNKTSVWHELLAYLLSLDGILTICQVESSPGVNNNSLTDDSQMNHMVRL